MNSNQPQRPDNKFYWMKLKKQLSKAGKTFYTGKFAYAVDVVGFEKEDGTITLFLAPQDMDKMKEQGFSQQQTPKQQQIQQRAPVMEQFNQAVQQQRQPAPQQQQPRKQFVDHTKPNPNWSEPPKNQWDDDEIPF